MQKNRYLLKLAWGQVSDRPKNFHQKIKNSLSQSIICFLQNLKIIIQNLNGITDFGHPVPSGSFRLNQGCPDLVTSEANFMKNL